MHRALDIHVRIVERIGHRAAHVHLGGVVIDDFGALGLKDLTQLGVANIQLVKFGFGVQVGFAARHQAVHDDHLVPGGDHLINYMGANKSGSACYHNFHDALLNVKRFIERCRGMRHGNSQRICKTLK